MKKVKKIFKALFYAIVVLMGIFAVLYLWTTGDWAVPQTVAQDSTLSHINVDGIVFHSEVFGPDTARVTVVIHGGPGQDYRYLLPMKQLADEYRIVFYDQRGTGLSPRVDASELTLESSIEDLHRVINHYSPNNKVNILGHSWGAMLGSGYLAKYPEKVHKVILAEPGFLTTEMAALFMERTNGFKIDISLDNLILIGKIFMRGLHVRGPDDHAVKDFIYAGIVNADVENHPLNGYFCGDSINADQQKFWRLSMVAAQSIQESQLDAEGKMQIDLVTGVDHYPDTVLLISGNCNRLIGPDYQQLHLKYFPRHKFEVIENAGHNMFVDQPEAFYALVRAHFSEGL